jgi:hypothetical protein
MSAEVGRTGLFPDEVHELMSILTLLEDWLIGVGYGVREDLTRFGGWAPPGADPERAVDEIVADLVRSQGIVRRAAMPEGP